MRPQNNRFRRDRNSGGRDYRDRGRENRSREMTEITCDKCGKKAKVPFKPSKDKPILCSECFEKAGNGQRGRDRGRGSFGRNRDFRGSRQQSGVSKEDFEKLNKKVDKILKILENVEIEELGEE